MSDAATIPADWQSLDRHFRYFQLLYVAIKTGIPAALASRAVPLPELASVLNRDPVRLQRVLRGLVWCGALDADDQEGYFLTDAGRCLLDEHQGSFADGIRWQGEFFFRAWGHLDDYLLTGATPFVNAYGGTPLFDLLTASPTLSDQFTAPMTAHSARLSAAIAAHPVFATARTIVDVGGGEGQVLIDVLQAHPEASGTVFDLPVLEAGATTRITHAGLLDRCGFAGGDMFAAVPPDADLYLLKWVIHDWNEERATFILRRCAEAMLPTSRLLIVERLMPEHVNATNAHLIQADLNMLCQNGGAERTRTEYETLLTRSGLHLLTIVPIDAGGGFFALEAARHAG